MKALRKLIFIIFIGTLMLSSCSATPGTSSLKEGHPYIYDGGCLYDLDELEYTHPMFTVDCIIPTDEEIYERVINDPSMFIITFTVVEYTKQNNIEKPAFSDFVGCTLNTMLRVDEIHYLGKEVQLKEGEIYNFTHKGAWILDKDGETMYTIHPVEECFYAAFKYGYQYVMCGKYVSLDDTLHISNSLGYNENLDREDVWFLK